VLLTERRVAFGEGIEPEQEVRLGQVLAVG
jgi:hypothetical protein